MLLLSHLKALEFVIVAIWIYWLLLILISLMVLLLHLNLLITWWLNAVLCLLNCRCVTVLVYLSGLLGKAVDCTILWLRCVSILVLRLKLILIKHVSYHINTPGERSGRVTFSFLLGNLALWDRMLRRNLLLWWRLHFMLGHFMLEILRRFDISNIILLSIISLSYIRNISTIHFIIHVLCNLNWFYFLKSIILKW